MLIEQMNAFCMKKKICDSLKAQDSSVPRSLCGHCPEVMGIPRLQVHTTYINY